MERPRLYKTEALILRHTSVGEADRILTLFAPYLGKLRVVARGVRRPKSKLAGHLEPLVHCRLMLARGRTLDVVAQAETLEGFAPLRSDLERTAQALCCAELVDAFAPESQPNEPVFHLLLGALRELASTGPQPEGARGIDSGKLLRHFELHLLGYLGFRPELHQCVECKRAITPGDHAFSPAGGGVVCLACRPRLPGPVLPLSLDALKVLRYLQGHEYDVVRALRMSPELAAEMERTLRTYVRHILEREPRAAAFLETVRRLPQ